jgi:hypothetical protein
MSVDVEIIGLCLLVMTGSGFVSVLPDWDGGAWIPGPNLQDHHAIVAVPKVDVVHIGSGWTLEGEFIDAETKEPWVYVVIEGEGVRFENIEPTDPPPAIPAKVPSLRHLCDKCVGIQPKYLTAGSGAASHVHFTAGTATTRKMYGRIDTIVTMDVITGRYLVIKAGEDKTLETKGSLVRVANFPIEKIMAGFPKPTQAEHAENHFLAFYKMASTWTGRRCRIVPQARRIAYALYGIDVDIKSLGAGCSNSQYP